MRVAMMGTGEFALPAFRALQSSRHEVVGLLTQPDRKGRGHHHHPHPMKESAVAAGIPVFQPENVNAAESLAELRELNAELCVVAAYGQILSADLLAIPRKGAVNIHASLLPKYRGAAPIQYAIWNGETETGITIFQIEPKLDAGPILAIERTPIGPDETAGELHDRLAQLGARMIVEVVDAIAEERAQPLVQEGSATKAPRLKKSDGIVDWTRSAQQVHDQIRAMQPWPKAFTWFSGESGEPQRLLLLASRIVRDAASSEAAGTVVRADADALSISTGDGVLELVRVQPEGKRAMTAVEFLNGHSIRVGQRLFSA